MRSATLGMECQAQYEEDTGSQTLLLSHVLKQYQRSAGNLADMLLFSIGCMPWFFGSTRWDMHGVLSTWMCFAI
jgi:hypothetical protein